MGIFATITNKQVKDASEVSYLRQMPNTSKFYDKVHNSCICVLMSQDDNLLTLDYRICVRDYFAVEHFIPDIFVQSTIDALETTSTQVDSDMYFDYSERGFVVDYLNEKIILNSAPSFVISEDDVLVINQGARVVTNVISQTELQFNTVADLVDSTGIFSQKMQTIDLTELQGYLGAGNIVKIKEAIPLPILESLVYLEDDTFESESNIGSHFRMAYQVTADDVNWSDVGEIPVSFESKIPHKNPSLSDGVFKVMFFAKNVSGDGVAKLKGWRAYFHKLTPDEEEI